MAKQIRIPKTSNELVLRLDPKKEFLDNYFDTVKMKDDPISPNARKGVRDYLNAEEGNNFLFLAITSLHMQRYINSWTKYGNITKDEHQAAQMSATYLYKFINKMASRLSDKQKDMYLKKMTSYGVKILDVYTEKKLYGDFDKELQVCHIPCEDFMDMASEMMKLKCNHCIKDHKECKTHDLFFEYWIPESSWELPNCRYAYDNNL